MHDMHVARDELERRLDDAALENDELRRAMTRQMADLDEVRGAQLVPISCTSRATSLYYLTLCFLCRRRRAHFVVL